MSPGQLSRHHTGTGQASAYTHDPAPSLHTENSKANHLQAPLLTLPLHPRQKHCGKTATSKCAHPAIHPRQKNCDETATSKCAHPAISSQAISPQAKQIVAKRVQGSVLTLPFHPRRPCARQHGQQWAPSPSSHEAQLAATQLGTPDSAPPTRPVLPGICKGKGACLVAYSNYGHCGKRCKVGQAGRQAGRQTFQ